MDGKVKVGLTKNQSGVGGVASPGHIYKNLPEGRLREGLRGA